MRASCLPIGYTLFWRYAEKFKIQQHRIESERERVRERLAKRFSQRKKPHQTQFRSFKWRPNEGKKIWIKYFTLNSMFLKGKKSESNYLRRCKQRSSNFWPDRNLFCFRELPQTDKAEVGTERKREWEKKRLVCVQHYSLRNAIFFLCHWSCICECSVGWANVCTATLS